MRRFVVGDVHGRFNLLNSFIKEKEADEIYVLGDFGLWKTQDGTYLHDALRCCKTKVFFIDGNHEDFNIVNSLKIKDGTPKEISNNVFYIPRGSVLEVGGKRVLCCGGARSVDFMYRARGLDWFEKEEMLTLGDLCVFLSHPQQKIDYVFSHTVPYFMVNPLMHHLHLRGFFPDNTCNVLEHIYELTSPSKWFFGHWHTHYTTKRFNTDFIGLSYIGNNKGDNFYFELKIS